MDRKDYFPSRTSSWSARWTIAGLCCFQSFLFYGLSLASGILYLESMSFYNVSRSEASFPYLLCFTSRYVTGPFQGYLGHRFGLRFVMMLGGLLSFLGTAGCFFAQEIISVSVLWGVLFGIGSGMGASMLPIVLSWHFGDKASKANGLCIAGYCVGSFVFPVVGVFLIHTFGLPGTFLLFSGVLLNSIPVAMLLKKPQTDSKASNVDARRIDFSLPEKPPAKADSCNGIPASVSHSVDGSLHDALQRHINGYKESFHFFIREEKSATPDAKTHHLPLPVDTKSLHSDGQSVFCQNYSVDATASDVLRSNATAHFPSSSDGSKLPSEQKGKNTTKRDFNAFAVFLDPTFVVIMISQSIVLVVQFATWTFILDHGRDCGVSPSQEVYILSVLSGVSLFGSLCLGWITDGGYASQIAFCACCFFGLSASLVTMAVANGFVVMIAAAILFSLMNSGILISLPGIVQEFVEKKDLTMAMTARTTLFGPLNIAMPFFIGFFRDTLGSYSELLFIFAALCGFGAFLSLVIPYLSRRRKNHSGI